MARPTFVLYPRQLHIAPISYRLRVGCEKNRFTDLEVPPAKNEVHSEHRLRFLLIVFRIFLSISKPLEIGRDFNIACCLSHAVSDVR